MHLEQSRNTLGNNLKCQNHSCFKFPSMQRVHVNAIGSYNKLKLVILSHILSWKPHAKLKPDWSSGAEHVVSMSLRVLLHSYRCGHGFRLIIQSCSAGPIWLSSLTHSCCHGQPTHSHTHRKILTLSWSDHLETTCQISANWSNDLTMKNAKTIHICTIPVHK